jgi:hypothetical protein
VVKPPDPSATTPAPWQGAGRVSAAPPGRDHQEARSTRWLHHRLLSRAPSGANDAFTMSQQNPTFNYTRPHPRRSSTLAFKPEA